MVRSVTTQVGEHLVQYMIWPVYRKTNLGSSGVPTELHQRKGGQLGLHCARLTAGVLLCDIREAMQPRPHLNICIEAEILYP